MQVWPATGPEQCALVLDKAWAFCWRAGFLVTNNGLHVLRFMECGWHDRLTIIKLPDALNSEQADGESKFCQNMPVTWAHENSGCERIASWRGACTCSYFVEHVGVFARMVSAGKSLEWHRCKFHTQAESRCCAAPRGAGRYQAARAYIERDCRGFLDSCL